MEEYVLNKDQKMEGKVFDEGEKIEEVCDKEDGDQVQDKTEEEG